MPPTYTENLATNTAAAQEIFIGVVADTHIPDRVNSLHPAILPHLKAVGVKCILHAGDICSRRVLEELVTVAPVIAVRGNRDFLAGPLPMVTEFYVGGVLLALMHGHGSWGQYLLDKWKYILFGYKLKRYLKLLGRVSQDVRVVVFGHTHYPENRWREGRLLFNPGSASFAGQPGEAPTIGLIRITQDCEISATIIRLEGWRIENRQWVKW
jgi:putative phosphoesterase